MKGGQYTLTHPSRPVGYEELTVSGLPVSLAGPTVFYDFAWIEVQMSPIRIRFDGNAPTATSGHVLTAGMSDILSHAEIVALKAIAVAADAILVATYYAK